MIDLHNPLEWNLIYREALASVNPLGGITPIIFPTSHHELVVGIKVADKPTWKWGGYLVEQVGVLPSSTAQLFPSLVQIHRYRLTCQQYQAIDLDPALPLPFFCTIEFPRYFRAAQVEVFARNDP
jgi:hypothetical protein